MTRIQSFDSAIRTDIEFAEYDKQAERRQYVCTGDAEDGT